MNFLGGLALVLATGCHTQSMPVRLQGDAVSIAWLAGAWVGRYWGGATPRGGSLSFTLRSGTDSVYGDVTMIGLNPELMEPVNPNDVRRPHVQLPRLLRIAFVVAHGDSVRGTLDPYISPDCDCVVATTFVGQVRGDALTGAFQSKHAGRAIADGQWEMQRVGDGRR